MGRVIRAKRLTKTVAFDRSPNATRQSPTPDPGIRGTRTASSVPNSSLHLSVMSTSPVLTVRPMEPSEVGIRIDYFHSADDNYLRILGVDRELLPSREAWRSSYEADCALAIRARQSLALIWELNGEIVGFSSTDQIVFGVDAHMHLHILQSEKRGTGLGTKFVKQSARYYFRVLEIERLFCEPNAFNIAPNRTLQRAGFRYEFTHQTKPGPINFFQATTRWVMDKANQPE